MKEIILKTNNLTKTYKKRNVLENFSITIRKGDIYGLIGKNGAGKTTLIRMITGVAAPTEGSIELFGQTDKNIIQESRKRVGTLIESPALFLDETGYENLNINRMQKGIKNKECIEKVMKIVGLTDVDKKKVKNYSLGMKQRLGIAKALLGNSDFLILDEPINGLDPMGIIEMRELFKDLNENHGVTILICSHILKELSLVATSYGIINNGNLIEELTAEELNNKCKSYILIKVNDVDKTVNTLKTKLSIENFEIINKDTIKIFNSEKTSGEINTALVTSGIVVEEIKIIIEDIENYFSNVIEGAAK
ncbi:MAG: ATP-binding cassette domain-containing protein [Clostridium sp.]